MSTVFISYVREDLAAVDRLVGDLRELGVTSWIDRERLGPGQRWQAEIRNAIANGSFFVACFSHSSTARETSYMNEELTLAIDELRRRTADRAWFIPVLLDDCEIPDRRISGAETLRDLQGVRMQPDWPQAVARLATALGAVDPPPSSATLEIAIHEWIEPDMARLTHDVYDRWEDGEAPEQLTVTLATADLDRLRAHVTGQSRRATLLDRIRTQRAALLDATIGLANAEAWAARVLTETSSRFGVGPALAACRAFLRLRLAAIAGGLATYQLEIGDEQPLRDAPRSYDTSPVAIAQRVYGRDVVVDVRFIPHDAPRPDFAAFLPIELIPTIAGDVYVSLPDEAIHFASKVWCEWVIPQMADRNARGIDDFEAWSPEEARFITDGRVWRGDDFHEATGAVVTPPD